MIYQVLILSNSCHKIVLKWKIKIQKSVGDSVIIAYTILTQPWAYAVLNTIFLNYFLNKASPYDLKNTCETQHQIKAK